MRVREYVRGDRRGTRGTNFPHLIGKLLKFKCKNEDAITIKEIVFVFTFPSIEERERKREEERERVKMKVNFEAVTQYADVQ